MENRHYVPNFVLSYFADGDGVLHVLDKQTGRRWLKKSGRNGRFSVFLERNYNPDFAERALMHLEAKASVLVAEIVQSAREGKPPVLEADHKKLLCEFLLVQTLRVPRMKSWVTGRKWERPEDQDVFWQMVAEISKADLATRLLPVESESSFAEYQHLERIVWHMLRMNVDVGTIKRESDACFVIGDEPCLRKGLLDRPGDRVVMPLAKDVYVQLSRHEDSIGGLSVVGKKLADALNRQAYAKARRFVAGPTGESLERARGATEC